MQTLRRGLWALMPLALLLAAATVAQACPGCKDALAANDPEHQNIVRGYFWSILFMMGTPYLVLCSFGGYLWLLVRRARTEKQAAEETQAQATEEIEVVSEREVIVQSYLETERFAELEEPVEV